MTTFNLIIVFATIASASTYFLPDCLWDFDLDTPDRHSRSRYRRFLWDDSDVCDWLCDPDLLPHETCNVCCRRSTIKSQPSEPQPHPSDQRPIQPVPKPQISEPIANNPPLYSEERPPIHQNWQVQSGYQLPQTFHTQNWPQSVQVPSNKNGYPPMQSQNWPQEVPTNEYQVPVSQNQNWRQQVSSNPHQYPQSSEPQNWLIQHHTPIPAAENEVPLNVQVPINLTGLIQAQVPSRMTGMFPQQPVLVNPNVQTQEVQPVNIPNQVQPGAVVLPQVSSTQIPLTSNGSEDPGLLQNVMKMFRQPFPQPTQSSAEPLRLKPDQPETADQQNEPSELQNQSESSVAQPVSADIGVPDDQGDLAADDSVAL